VLDVELKLRSGEMAEIEKKLRWCLERRAEWQPAKPSAGSIFKNPPEGRTAGELIELCGLKGASRGGAAVSARHGNVIVNRGRATARDVIGLMDLISERVRATTGVELEPEVVVVGDEGA
jgi:UDP-N-acetylmuramate dehydrogenase